MSTKEKPRQPGLICVVFLQHQGEQVSTPAEVTEHTRFVLFANPANAAELVENIWLNAASFATAIAWMLDIPWFDTLVIACMPWPESLVNAAVP